MDEAHIHARRWLTLATLCLSLLIIVMDNTILNVAIPSLVEQLGATNSQLQWIIDGYTLVFAGLLLTTGSLGDRFGRKLALRTGILIFTTGSICSALSGSATQLIAARAFMGIGGALIMPSTLSILTNVFTDAKERGKAIAIWAGFSGLGVAIGPMTGGLLLKHFSWSSVFWVNLPISATALVAGYFLIPESKDPSAPKIDLPGAVLSIVGLGALLFGIIEGPAQGWSDPTVIAGFVVGVLGLAAFMWWERTTDSPMLDLSFFKNPRFSAANGAITITFFAMFGSLFLMTQYWQFVHGYTPLEAGVRLLPYAAVMMFVAPQSAKVVERFGSKRVVAFGMTTMAVAMLLLSTIHSHTPYVVVISFFCLNSFGMGFVMAPATESVMGSLPRDKAGVGAAMNDTTRQVGGALGVAVIGSIVSATYVKDIARAGARAGLTGRGLSDARDSLGGALGAAQQLGQGAGAFVSDAKDAFVHALSYGLRFSALAMLIAAAVAYRFLPARAADHVDEDTRLLADAEAAYEVAQLSIATD